MLDIDKFVDDHNMEGALRADGLDAAAIGFILVEPCRIVYSVKKVVDILIDRDGMTMADAIEFFYFNIGGAHLGEHTPVWLEDFDD